MRLTYAAACLLAVAPMTGHRLDGQPLAAIDTLLAAPELAAALARGGAIPRTRSDTVGLLLDAGMWNWEGHGAPRPTIRYFCAAAAMGISQLGRYRLAVQILRSYQAWPAAVDLLREAARRWPQERWVWREMVDVFAYAGLGEHAATLQAQIDARHPIVPQPLPGGCEATLRRSPAPGRAA